MSGRPNDLAGGASVREPTRHAFVSVIVPHLDDLDNLSRAVAALRAQTLPPSRYEIIVADNGSRCGLDAVRAAAAGATVVAIGERGAGPARNGGVRAARGEVLAFTDSDCRPRPDWLEQGLAALASADVVGGCVDVGVDDPAAMSPSEAFEAVFAFDNRDYIERLGFTVTANLFVRRDTFERIGPFRTAVSEDVEWCRRSTRRGGVLRYAGDARVTHPARRTWSELERKWQRTNREAYELWRADGRSRIGWALRALAVLVSPAFHWPRVLRSTALANTRSRIAALAVLLRLRVRRAGWMLRQAISGSPKQLRASAAARLSQEAR